MSFQLRVNNNTELRAINIAFGRQFMLPIALLVCAILCASSLLEVNHSVSPPVYGDDWVDPANIGHIQQQLATLEGESQRLKAFAKKMVTLAKLDKTIFDFDKPPARGGLGGRNVAQRYTIGMVRAVDRDIDHLTQQLIERSNQFERMQLILQSRLLGESEKQSRWPVTTAYISSHYGMRKDPFTGRLRKHRGIDFAGPRGSSVRSIAAGKVVFAGRKGGYGRVVEIKHANGLLSRYAHLQLSLVKKGQSVVIGEKIAKLGSSGRSTGPHLHLEILKNNKNINPLVFLGKQRE
ncbi:MAG: M23 family metallopeptidase [Leucothrix sp.]